jgi:hypothetical protein
MVISPDRESLNFDRFGYFEPQEGRYRSKAHGKGQFTAEIKIIKDCLIKKKWAGILWYGNCLSDSAEDLNRLEILLPIAVFSNKSICLRGQVENENVYFFNFSHNNRLDRP